MRRAVVTSVALLACAACETQRATDASQTISPSPSQSEPAAPEAVEAVLVPDLVGLREADVGTRLAELDEAGYEVSSSWMGATVLDCSAVPGTVVHQEPPPGTPVEKRADIEIRTASLDLDRFRGPCDPATGELGPVRGADARLARDFYRFAADPGLGAPFVDGDIWVGIEDGPTHVTLSAGDRARLGAWQIDTWYAEASGPFSALDIVASSGGYYEVHRGVRPACPSGRDGAPPELEGLRAITLTAARDTVSACMQWWGVTLFLDGDVIAGVALRLGSP